MSNHADILYVTDKLQHAEKALGEYLYACKNASCLRKVKNESDLIKLLRSFTSVRRLVILLHSAPGAIMLDGNYLDLEKLAAKLKGTPLRVTEEIVFDGCNIGTRGPAVIEFMRALRAPKAIGYSVYHAYAFITIPITKENVGVESQKIEEHPQYAAVRKYLLPGQINPKEIVKKPGTYMLYYEFFTRDPGAGAITAEWEKEKEAALGTD